MSKYQEEEIINSWKINASPWINAIREKQIESRQLVTNQEIINTILSRSPKNVLDIGCGEGWLSHELIALSINVIGFDAIPELVEKANQTSPNRFFVSTYENFSENVPKIEFDLAVCNFSLFGDRSVEHIFKSTASVLKNNGHLIIQTLHPRQSQKNQPYKDGWHQGSWAGFDSSFTQPAPWYFRTTESWLSLFSQSGYEVIETIEPLHPKTQKPTSLIVIGQLCS
ncbi:MAG: class I SAM-dependent methyltransferase [Leptolyngbya sp. SIO1D8]|nr:class I SAM-dependent methyltransferase [Leptolyngbya sp. SIO1D8]